PNNLEQQLFNLKENIKEERTQDDILYEIILKSGLSLSEKIEVKEIQNKKVYSIMNGFLIICLEKDLNLDFIKAIAELKPAKIVCLDIGFKNNDQLKTNAVQIMKSIKFDGENSIEFKTV
ncbi:MAG: site-specific DNA-methyltransferase, partial [Fusobacteria bacterium]|nr:site-specific DNA-methyltransferase [Fusobacteriota bacterium]